MIKEHDLVALSRTVPEHLLEPGGVGTVVARYPAGGHEVEFVSAAGDTVALLTLTDSDVRLMRGAEILHVRGLALPSRLDMPPDPP